MAIPSFRGDSRVPARLVGTSVGLTLLLVVEIGVHLLGFADWSNTEALVFSGEFAMGVATAAPFVVGIGYAGYWLRESDLPVERFGRVWKWTLVGVVASVLLNLALMAVLPVPSVLLFVAWVRWGVALGAGVGVLVGVTEARAIQNATDAERSAVRAEHLEAQRDVLDYLNGLLRHEVLNASNVISGYAGLLKEEHDEESTAYEYSDTIHRRSEEITTVIKDVRVLLLATQKHGEVGPVDLTEVLASEAEKLRDLDEDVDVETSMPESVYVRGDPLLPRAFGNLLANAVEHNDSSPPEVSVDVSAGDEEVVVEIADNGPGIPDDEVETLFERPSQRTSDNGLGTYLTAKLVEHYDGEVELAGTGPDGSTFRVTFPTVQSSSGRADGVFPFGAPADW